MDEFLIFYCCLLFIDYYYDCCYNALFVLIVVYLIVVSFDCDNIMEGEQGGESLRLEIARGGGDKH